MNFFIISFLLYLNEKIDNLNNETYDKLREFVMNLWWFRVEFFFMRRRCEMHNFARDSDMQSIAPDYDLVDICRGGSLSENRWCTSAINTIINDTLRLSVIWLRGLTIYWITALLDAHVRTTPAYSDNNDAAFRDWLEDKREDILRASKSRACQPEERQTGRTRRRYRNKLFLSETGCKLEACFAVRDKS